MSAPIDIGHGVTISYFVWSDDPDAPRVGLIEEHPDGRDPSKRCTGSVWFDVPGVPPYVEGRHRWTVKSWEPLTLSPSILCRVCGHHGFVREGKWVPA